MGRGLSVHAWTIPGPDSCEGKPRPLNLLTCSTLAPLAALWTCQPVCLQTWGPPGRDPQSQSPLRTPWRKAALPPTALRGTLPLGASLSRPPGPALAPSQDTALPGLKSQSSVPAWGQGGGLRLSGALHVCCAAAWTPPGAWPRLPAPRLLGLLPPSPRLHQELEHGCGTAAPNCMPSCPPAVATRGASRERRAKVTQAVVPKPA